MATKKRERNENRNKITSWEFLPISITDFFTHSIGRFSLNWLTRARIPGQKWVYQKHFYTRYTTQVVLSARTGQNIITCVCLRAPERERERVSNCKQISEAHTRLNYTAQRRRRESNTTNNIYQGQNKRRIHKVSRRVGGLLGSAHKYISWCGQVRSRQRPFCVRERDRQLRVYNSSAFPSCVTVAPSFYSSLVAAVYFIIKLRAAADASPLHRPGFRLINRRQSYIHTQFLRVGFFLLILGWSDIERGWGV